jgi:hypothetical protein
MNRPLSSALWIALLALPLTAQAGEPSAAPAARPAPLSQEQLAAQSRRRLLHARGGGVLRVESRLRDGHWEYQRKGEDAWIALPPGVVSAARLESEALDELHSRRAALGRTTPDQLTGLAQWALDEGLYEEGLKQLDELLADDPDQPDALALLHRDDLPLRLPGPDSPGELLQFAMTAPPALREIAVLRMTQIEDQAPLRVDLLAHLSGKTIAERSMAALALRRLSTETPCNEAEFSELLRRCVRDVAVDVRHGCALALRDAHQEGLVLPIIDAMGSSSGAIRVNAAEALGLMAYSAAVPALMDRLATLPASGGAGSFNGFRSNIFVGTQIAFVQDFNAQVAQNAAIADPEIGTLQSGVGLDVTVMGISGPGYVAESTALRHSLEQLTGAKPGNSVAAWKTWWSTHKGAWDGTAPATPGAPTAGG